MMDITVNVRISLDETATALLSRLIETLAQPPVAPATPTPVETPTAPIETASPLVEVAPAVATPPATKKARSGVQKRQPAEQPKVVESEQINQKSLSEQTPEEVIASTEVATKLEVDEATSKHTIEEIRVLATNLKQKGHGEAVRNLLKDAGYNQLTDVPASDMDGCYDALQDLTTQLLGISNG